MFSCPLEHTFSNREFRLPSPASPILMIYVMALFSPSLMPIVVIISLLLAPGCPRLPARYQRHILDRRVSQQGSSEVESKSHTLHTEHGCKFPDGTPCWSSSRTVDEFYPPWGPAAPSPQPPPSPSVDRCDQQGTCQPPPSEDPDPPQIESPSGSTPASPSPPPPAQSPPPGKESRRQRSPPRPSPDVQTVTPTKGAEQGKKSNSSIASAVGWAFLSAGLALQVVFAAYLAYQRRELQQFSSRLEKVPSVSPPPSPLGFAPYTAAN